MWFVSTYPKFTTLKVQNNSIILKIVKLHQRIAGHIQNWDDMFIAKIYIVKIRLINIDQQLI